MLQMTHKVKMGRWGATRVATACVALGLAAAMLSMANPVSASTNHPASAGTTHAATSATVTLQFWSAYNETDTEASTIADVVIPRFEQLNPGIKVVSDVYPYGVLLQKFVAAAAAGRPPDVMRSDIARVPELSSDGLLLQLNTLPWYAATVKCALPGPMATTEWRGSFYALPLDTNTQALFWTKADFAAAGIKSPPTTMTQMFADAQKLTNTSEGHFGLGVDGTDIWNVAPYIWSDGGAFTNANYTRATGYMDDAGTQAAVQELVNLDKAGVIGSDLKGGAGAVSGEAGFPKDDYAMYIDGPWAVTTYNELKPAFKDYGISLFPSGPGGSASTVGGEDAIIPADGHHLTDAAKFAQFLDSPFSQLAMAKTGQMSAFATDGAAEVKATPYYSIFAQQLQTAKVRAVSPFYSQMDTIFSNELQEILAGKVTVAKGLTSAAEAANVALLSGL